MINLEKPDYTDTPASDRRAEFGYAPAVHGEPILSIVTPYFNTGPVFWETFRAIQRMSFVDWEWIIVDDGSTEEESLRQLEDAQHREPRIRVMRQSNAGPAVARNHAVREARGRFIMLLDSDDLVEPTFAEKAIWFLSTQPQFAACNSCNVTFGSKNILWPHGFEGYEHNLKDNWITNMAVIRRDAFISAGGFDETLRYGHEDWDLWLNLAEAGFWGYTIQEYLTWYRDNPTSRRMETSSSKKRQKEFHQSLLRKHGTLHRHFPRPVWASSLEMVHSDIRIDCPVENPLVKPAGVKRVLLLVPWLEIGGADKFNLDLISELSSRGYQFTVVTTLRGQHAWLDKFTQLTPDVFCMHQFLNYGDYPRFIDYLIRSREIDAVIVSNSELAYGLIPFLRARHPHLGILDYTHSETEKWKNGGYPGMAVRAGRQIDVNVTNTEHLKRWMVARGAEESFVEVCRCAIDTQVWDINRYDRNALRAQLALEGDIPTLLFVGRFSPEKRVLTFLQIVRKIAETRTPFRALIVGTGEQESAAHAFVDRNNLRRYVRFMGAQPQERVREIMVAGDILILPSQIEGLALVLFECMAMETVPVAVDIAGHPELVTPDCGVLIPRSQDEVTEYTSAVLHLIRDTTLRREMARRGREKVIGSCGMATLGDRFEAAIARACAIGSTRPDVTRPQLDLALMSAHNAIEYMRVEEFAMTLWAQQHAPLFSLNLLRRARESILPIGSERYEVYKRFRQGLRHAKARLSVFPRRLLGRGQTAVAIELLAKPAGDAVEASQRVQQVSEQLDEVSTITAPAVHSGPKH